MTDLPNTDPVPLLTVGRIANRLMVTPHRVVYVITTRGIRHVATAGGYRLFDEAAVARIRYELNAVDARRADDAEGGAK